ncbi:MAG: hypothetical protein MUE40_04485 [Anaerolineae bacterium]|jgi:hypothetical protein|nr:hypothetical protein [Anaerolineae bacterium]
MPTLDSLTQEVALFEQRFQELTARIYKDGFVTCDEALEGTAYYRRVRPRLRRLHSATRRWIKLLHRRYSDRLLLRPDSAAALAVRGNQVLQAYHTQTLALEKLLTDSQVMLKIFADVLHDCTDDDRDDG